MSWEQLLEMSISSISELANLVDVADDEMALLEDICEEHPLRISQYYLSLIDMNDKTDPIRRLAIPLAQERHREGTYDTSGEKSNTIFQGLQHKYRQTAVILSTNECAMYCRHCFRKRLVGLKTDETLQDLDRAIDYISRHQEIRNVLITGGDPFTLSNEKIKEFIDAFSGIKHLDFIRFGTRVPVTFPQRILHDEELLGILGECNRNRKRIYIVTQYNHPNEITELSTKAIQLLRSSDITISNQTVLLKEVNDDKKTLALLQRRLTSIGVLPYYVFQCRPVKRVKKHFQVPLYRGYHIVSEARKLLDGHSKRFRFIMSHPTGKIEILGVLQGHFVFKYHQAKAASDLGRIFTRPVDKSATWLDDLEE